MKAVKLYSILNGGDVHDTRQTMQHLPSWFQFFLTWLTGKPLKNEKPAFKRSGLSHLSTAYLMVFSGLTLSVCFYSSTYYGLLAISWLFTVSGARKLVTTINHYCVHHDLIPFAMRKKYGYLHEYIAEFNSSILFLQDFKTYKREHHEHHNVSFTATLNDPDMIFMWQLGFKPGLSKLRLWFTLAFNLIFPFSKLHLFFVVSRLKTIIHKGTNFRYIIMALTVGAISLIMFKSSFALVFWAIIFPLTYLYHIAALLQFASEHIWLKEVNENGKVASALSKTQLISRSRRVTVGRMMGEPISNIHNNPVLRIIYLIWWLLKMLLIHLPLRLFVVPGDLVQHDLHHRSKNGDDWANAAYTRQRKIEELTPDSIPFIEVWGLWNVIDLVFTNLSQLPPIEPLKEEITPDAIMGM